ncbi:MAG: hypothetical protein QXH26_01055 [Candidatus Hadarchaeales archaeon]
MWLVTTALLAIAATAAKFALGGRYQLGFLSLMLWGATLMILVDHLIGWWKEGGEFLSVATEGWVESGALLGLLMFIPVLILWLASLGLKK